MIVNVDKPTNDPSMSPTIPFRRPTRSTKVQLLPIARSVADELALQAYLSLESLRAGCADIAPAQQVTEVMLLAKFLADAGHGNFPDQVLVESDQIMASVFDGGRASGLWRIHPDGFDRLAAVVSLYDYQLRRASLGALGIASGRLERMKAGEPYQGLKKRA